MRLLLRIYQLFKRFVFYLDAVLKFSALKSTTLPINSEFEFLNANYISLIVVNEFMEVPQFYDCLNSLKNIIFAKTFLTRNVYLLKSGENSTILPYVAIIQAQKWPIHMQSFKSDNPLTSIFIETTHTIHKYYSP